MGDVLKETKRLRLLAIDFEKSVVLRGPYPLTTAPTVDPKSLWPKEFLADMLHGMPIPRGFCETIERTTEDALKQCFSRIETSTGQIEWLDNSIVVLHKRAENIHALVREVWR